MSGEQTRRGKAGRGTNESTVFNFVPRGDVMFFNDHDGKPVDPGREALKGWCRNNPEEAFKASILGTRIAIAILVIGGLIWCLGLNKLFGY